MQWTGDTEICKPEHLASNEFVIAPQIKHHTRNYRTYPVCLELTDKTTENHAPYWEERRITVGVV